MIGRKLFSSGLALALVASYGSPVRAEILKNLKTDGSIEVRTFGIDNEVDLSGPTDDYRSDMRTRLMGGASFDVLDDVHARVLLRKNNRLYGQGSENLNSVETALAVDNANVKIDKVFGRVDLTMGRQFYGKSDDLAIYFGPNNDDILSVAALDAFRADADIMGWAKLQAIAGKTVEDTPVSATAPGAPTNTNADTDLYGGMLSTDKIIPQGGLGVSYYTLNTKGGVALGNNRLALVDIGAQGNLIAGLSYTADFIQNFGRDHTVVPPAGGSNAYDGSAYFLGLNFNKDMSGRPFRAHGEYGRGENRFAAISPGKRFGIIWGEHSTVGPSTVNRGPNGTATGLSNLLVYDLGAGINPIAKLGVDLNWYRFQYDANNGGVGTSAGTEYDLILSWKHSDNVSLEASAASLQVGDGLVNSVVAPGTPTSPITRLGADVKITF